MSWFNTAWKVNRYQRAATRPGRYVKNRAKTKALGALGLWRFLRGVYRA